MVFSPCNINPQDYESAIQIAKYTEKRSVLIKKIMDPKTKSLELTELCKLYGTEDVLNFIVNVQDSDTGDTLLLTAIYQKNATLAQELEQVGADLSIANYKENSPEKFINYTNSTARSLKSKVVSGLRDDIETINEAILMMQKCDEAKQTFASKTTDKLEEFVITSSTPANVEAKHPIGCTGTSWYSWNFDIDCDFD